MAWDNISYESIMRKHRAVYFFNVDRSEKGVLWKTVLDDAKIGFMIVTANTASQSLNKTAWYKVRKENKWCISK